MSNGILTSSLLLFFGISPWQNQKNGIGLCRKLWKMIIAGTMRLANTWRSTTQLEWVDDGTQGIIYVKRYLKLQLSSEPDWNFHLTGKHRLRMSEMVEIPCTATCIIPSCLNVKMYSKLYTVQCRGYKSLVICGKSKIICW